MNVTQLTKTDFIKFNVSPEFKTIAKKKAKENGMTVSELGRMLFGAFVVGMARPSLNISPEFLALVEQAKQNNKKGLGVLVNSKEELNSYLETL